MSNRYDRIAGVEWIGKEGLARLQEKRVVLFGVGNIGGQTAYHLALLGIDLTLVDCGVVENPNLATQGFEQSEIGVPKVEALTRRLKAIHPDGKITPVFKNARELGLAAFREAELFLCCLDSLRDRLWINEMACRMGIPWIDAAIDGTGAWLFGKASIHPLQSEEAACFLCPWETDSLQSALLQERERAEQFGGKKRGCPDWRRLVVKRGAHTPPTFATSGLGGMVAGLQSILAIDLLLKRNEGRSSSGREICIDLTASPFRIRESEVRRNKKCLFDHRRFDPMIQLPGGTVGEIFEQAERALGGEVLLQLHGRVLIGSLICPECRVRKELWKIEGAIESSESICRCGVEMQILPHTNRYHFRRKEATPFLERACSEIGLEPGGVVTATGRGRELHFVIG